jgi:hypothetical protein
VLSAALRNSAAARARPSGVSTSASERMGRSKVLLSVIGKFLRKRKEEEAHRCFGGPRSLHPSSSAEAEPALSPPKRARFASILRIALGSADTLTSPSRSDLKA